MSNVQLTSKELLIIQLICKQLTSDEIAVTLRLSPGTIENYKRKIQKKVGAKNVVGIAIYAWANGLIERGTINQARQI